MSNEEYRNERIRQKIQQKYNRGRQPYLGQQFQSRRLSNMDMPQDHLVNPFNHTQKGHTKIKPMILNRSSSDFKKR
jgi:hypothetical protein